MTTNFIAITEGKLKTKASSNRKFWITALYFCGIGGLSTGLIGLLLSALEFFGFVERAAQSNRIGTWLMVIAFPVVMFGAHAMDKIAEIDKKEKRNL